MFETVLTKDLALTLCLSREVLVFVARVTSTTQVHVDQDLLKHLASLPPQVFADTAKIGLHLEESYVLPSHCLQFSSVHLLVLLCQLRHICD